MVEDKDNKKLIILKRIVINDTQDEDTPRETKEDFEGKLDRLTKLENAALLIQRNARSRIPALALASLGSSRRKVGFGDDVDIWNIDEESTSDGSSNDMTVHEKEEEGNSSMFTLLFVACGSIIMMLYSYMGCCMKSCFGNNFEDDERDGYMMDAADLTEVSMNQTQNATTSQAAAQAVTPGGAGGSGAESAAANSAAASVASGVSSGIAAGAVAASAAGMMGGTVVAATTTTKIVTVAVVTAAAYSTYQGVELLTPPEAQIPLAFSSRCGIENPESRSGDFTLFFDGLARGITEREVALFEGLVVGAYNNLTFGSEFDESTETYRCVDEYLREMKESNMIDQIYQEEQGNQSSVLQINMESTIICEGCPAELPIFGTVEETAPLPIERYLRRMSTTGEIFDISFIEQYLRTIIESLFELMNEGELPTNFSPSKIYFRGFSRGNQTDGSENLIFDEQAIEVDIPIGVYDDKISGAIIPVFPTASTNQNNGIDFHEGNFSMSLTGVSLSRPFTPEESIMLEKLFVEAYNEVTAEAGAEGGEASFSQLREMARASLIGQQLITGDDGLPALELTFKGFVTCEGCPADQSLFGDINGEGLDLELIQKVLQRVIVDVVKAIEDDDLPAEFLPAELSVEDDATDLDLVNVPIFTEVGENGTIKVDMPDLGLAPQQFEDEFFISFRGFDRIFDSDEGKIVEELLIEAYNSFTLGSNSTNSTNTYSRKMVDAVLKDQILTNGTSEDGDVSTLDMILDVTVLCDDCTSDEPVFGLPGAQGLLDWTFIEGVMINVITSMMQKIQEKELSDSFVPDEITTHTDDTQDFFVSIPMESYFDPETGTWVFELLPTIVELPSLAPSSSPSPLPPQQFEDEFFISFRGFDRIFDSDEGKIVEELLIEAYNSFTLGSNSTNSTNTYSRKMVDAVLKDQILTNGTSEDGDVSTLDMILDVTVLCDDCTSDEPVFGLPGAQGLLDWTFIEGVMINVITSMMQKIQEKELSDSFVPDEITTHTDDTQDFFVSIPMESYFDPETGTWVFELLPTIVELASMAPSLSPSPSSMPSEAPSGVPSNFPSFSTTTAVTTEPSDAPSSAPSLSLVPTQQPTKRASRMPTPAPSIAGSGAPSSTPSSSPSSSPTSRPSATPSIVFSGQPTFTPSSRPSRVPSTMPSKSPSASPSMMPSTVPSIYPTVLESVSPSASPSTSPPTDGPTNGPTPATPEPTKSPTSGPTNGPTPATPAPTSGPTDVPTPGTPAPTDGPTNGPTPATPSPTRSPTSGPTSGPTFMPTTKSPTSGPTSGPTKTPTSGPTRFPTSSPTSPPTIGPTGTPKYWMTCGNAFTLAPCTGITAQFVDPLAIGMDDGTGFVMETGVRCCADSPPANNWRISRNSVWANDGDAATNCPYAISPGSCSKAQNFFQAEAICAAAGGRLCSRAETEAGCAGGAGCNFDTYPIWTSDSNIGQ
ncbi:unnamed protein product [Cylindrotheca closterium]|uniref:Uncharacterized protein n=1 Tax=Cylindrotheca closterium TaxID=2856 RepID=A0AAD2PY26_9STRA|nr:unnamed protein product [Cylindrotheca closterium]